MLKSAKLTVRVGFSCTVMVEVDGLRPIMFALEEAGVDSVPSRARPEAESA